jgi:hypothetical protein
VWYGRVKKRQNRYVTPKVIVPFVNRLIQLGILPKPASWKAEWPDISAVTDTEKATIALQRMQALSQYVSGGVDNVIEPKDALVRVIGFSEEEAEAMINSKLEQQQAEFGDQAGDYLDIHLREDMQAQQQAEQLQQQGADTHEQGKEMTKLQQQHETKLLDKQLTAQQKMARFKKGAANNELVEHGGSGSGNFGHKGRPGEVGGSGEGGEKLSSGIERLYSEGYGPKMPVHRNPSKTQLKALLANTKAGLRGVGDGKGNIWVWPANKAIHATIAQQLEIEHESWAVTGEEPILAKAGLWFMFEKSSDIDKAFRQLDKVRHTNNVFCPTGEGGGIDPTCSPPGSGTVAGAKSAKKRIAKDVEVELRANISKVKFSYGQVVEDLNTWLNDEELNFKTTYGRKFTVHAKKLPLAGSKAVDFSFYDDRGQYLQTNRGEAVSIFSNVVSAVGAYINKHDPSIITFSAEGESRQKLYDRLTKTMSALFPDYKASYAKTPFNREYYVYKPHLRNAIATRVAAGDYGTDLKPLVNSSVLIDIEPEIDPVWFDEELHRGLTTHGGAGSGNFGHAGRPGEVGGSAKNRIAKDVETELRANISKVKFSYGQVVEDYYPGLEDDMEITDLEELMDESVVDELNYQLYNKEISMQEYDTAVRDWFRAHPEVLKQASAKTPNTWLNDRKLNFKTPSGREFTVHARKFTLDVNGNKAVDFSFQDDRSQYHKTGKGEAVSIFSNVVSAVGAYVAKHDPPIITFSAEGGSRQKLYDRLTKTMAALFPQYKASYTDNPHQRQYYVYKPELRNVVAGRAAKTDPAGELTDPLKPLVNSSVLIDIEPEIDPVWFTEEGWGDEELHRGLTTHGGAGSGNFGHAGRPGEVGGSAPDTGGSYGGEREYRQDLQGEFWIQYGRSLFADGDIGDMNHEGYAIDSAQREVIDAMGASEFSDDEYADWDGFEAWLDEQYEEDQDKIAAALKEAGVSDELYQAALGMGDVRAFAIEHWGWIRLAGNDAQMGALTKSSLDNLANGIDDAYQNEDLDNQSFNIETKTGYYTDVPWSVLESGDVGAMREYKQHGMGGWGGAENRRKRRMVLHGGKGSGNFGHKGRPGEVGGSGPGDVDAAKLVRLSTVTNPVVKAKKPYQLSDTLGEATVTPHDDYAIIAVRGNYAIPEKIKRDLINRAKGDAIYRVIYDVPTNTWFIPSLNHEKVDHGDFISEVFEQHGNGTPDTTQVRGMWDAEDNSILLYDLADEVDEIASFAERPTSVVEKVIESNLQKAQSNMFYSGRSKIKNVEIMSISEVLGDGGSTENQAGITQDQFAQWFVNKAQQAMGYEAFAWLKEEGVIK